MRKVMARDASMMPQSHGLVSPAVQVVQYSTVLLNIVLYGRSWSSTCTFCDFTCILMLVTK